MRNRPPPFHRIPLLLALLLAGLPFRADSAGAPTNAPSAKPAPRIYRDRIEPRWFAGHNRFSYSLTLGDGIREFIVVDADTGAREPAFDHARLAETLGRKLGREIPTDRLPLGDFRFTEDGQSIEFKMDGRKFRCRLEDYTLNDEGTVPPPAGETERTERRRSRTRPTSDSRSPDGRWEARVHGHNLVLRDLKSGHDQPLTHDGNPGHSYARSVQRERFLEMRYNAPEWDPPVPEVYWSPDSRRLVAMRLRPGTERTVHLVASSPEDQLQPKLESYPYLKPGDEIPVRKPHLFDVDGAREIPIDDTLFATPWSIDDLRWSRDSARFTFVYNQRGHQVLRVVAVDAATGAAISVIEERSATFIHYSGKFFCEHLDESGEILWMSERNGWNHLYLYDARNGQVRNQVTQGNWVVRGVDHVDREKRQVWFRASGVHPGQDPYYVHAARVNFDGTGLTFLTSEDGTHAIQWSPDHRFFIDTWSRVDKPPRIELRRGADGALVALLEEADTSELSGAAWQPPERFVAKGRDGTTDIFGLIHRPPGFDPAARYPVIESIYAGPHDSFVPKAFQASYSQEKLARRGFIVVQIDGMGTSNRSKKFHDVCWKNLGDAGFPDRVLWIRAAAQRYPQMDLSRIGIYGTSAGGQSALRGLLAHGEFYKAGVADCGCHDNRMDKIWWNEQWMGWPVGRHYHEQSNVTQAHRLEGALLLMVGELDRNVDPASTLQVANALIKADKPFELLLVPGGGHGILRTPYGWKRLEEFFVRHLHPPAPAVNPPKPNGP